LSRQARLDQSLPFRSPSFVAETITGEDGRFELHNLASGTFDLRVKSSGFAETVVHGIEIAVGDGAVDFGTAVLEPGVDLHGRTVDPEGRPLAEVGVSWIPWQPGQWYRGFSGSRGSGTTSDAAGRFVIEDLARGDKLTLEARRDGFTQARIAGVEVPAGEPVVLVLEARAKIRGVVVDTRGEPVAKALVSVVHEDTDGGSGSSGRGCDSEGRFELEADASGRLKITASAPGFRSTDLGLEIAPGEVVDDLRLVLSLGAVVDGRILGPGGDPIAGADVSFFQLHFRYRSRERIVSDAEGRFRLEGLDVGPLVLRVWAEGFPRQSRQLEVQPGANPVEIRFETTHQIHGRVVDEAWSPVGGASVHASNQDHGSAAMTGADGTFTVEGLPDGSYRLSAGKEGFARSELDREVEIAGGPVFGVEIRLSAGGAVAGRILGLDPGLLAGVVVTLEPGRRTTASRPGGGASTTAVDALGGYRFELLNAGEWTVVAIEPASGRTARGHTTLGPGDDEVVLDVEFVDGLTLAGRVLVDGEPAPMVRVEVEGLDVLSAGQTRTDYRGGFRLVDLRPGRYRLEARRQELVEHREIELQTDREIEIELSTYDVGGMVLDAADAGALVGAEVMLLPLTGGGERPSVTRAPRLRTDSRGLFRFVGVAEGSYRLRVEHRGYGPLEEPIAVGAGADPGALELRLARVEGLTLKIRRAAGGVPRWVSVLALDGSGVPVLATSVAVAEDGTAPLSSLPAGNWLLIIAAPDAGVARQAVDAPRDPVAVVLPPATRIDVRVLELAGTGGLATLTVTDSGGRPFVSVASSYPVHMLSEWSVRDGRATVEGLPPGHWQLAVTTADGRSWSASVSAPATGGNVQLDLD
ncbi:MAG: carboxypeptidase regulatory-like domain-containing protein, partial [Thermoanaerobaculia bacterium]